MRNIILAFAAIMCSISVNAQMMKVMKGDEIVATYTIDEADHVIFEESKTTQPPMPGPHDYVDLGLSVKWATCNIGADTPEKPGLYFAWGETTGYGYYNDHKFNWGDYKWCNGSSTTLTKYCTDSAYGIVDNKTTLDSADDAAHVNWGASWRMPTKKEYEELRNNCTWVWTWRSGTHGLLFTSKINYNTLFLPAAGYCSGSIPTQYDSRGFYWTSDLAEEFSFGDTWGQGWSNLGSDIRCYGRSIRAVYP